ncbi:MAG: Eco57I restriction-modification methylase domain-containing protein, partial [Vallitaleaceae bacterium]|nr:Eco57I restriction-modification methylase domain-containing protein [Vallitaleaceae bacterium]
YPNLRLHNRDFLTTNSKNSYDGIIMNPPYIRQEKINHLAGYGITKKVLRKLKLYDALPSTANLYMYFIVKAIELLQPAGELVVIFPSSWLNARSGQFFKEYLYSKCTLLQQVHISGEVFEKNALVEVVILKLQKGASLDVLPLIKHIGVQNGVLIQKENDKESVNLGFKMHFNAIAKVRRGLTTGYNNMFINPPLIDEESKRHIKAILSTPKAVCGYGTQSAKKDDILIYDEKKPLSMELSRYINGYKKSILAQKSPKTLYNKIKREEKWFSLKEINCKGILFSYFVRNDMKFILNEDDCLVRDNFYIIYPQISSLLMLALLNNFYTFYQLEVMGKKYGAGLLKLQRYDIENLLFPTVQLISAEDCSELKRLSQDLILEGDVKIINSITHIVSKYSSVNYPTILDIYQNEKKRRLE